MRSNACIASSRGFQTLKHEVEQRTTHARIGAEQARNSILMLGGQSGGGSNFNVVPENCWFTIDRRINSRRRPRH